ncbi:MAG: hypothetical protein ACM3TR_07995 [Caulobacteraceae bacterium]
MDKKLDCLLLALDDEIEKKCCEIKRKRAEQRMTRLFVLVCSLFVTVPVLLVFAGINLFSLSVPVLLFLSISMFALSPIIFSSITGGAVR